MAKVPPKKAVGAKKTGVRKRIRLRTKTVDGKRAKREGTPRGEGAGDEDDDKDDGSDEDEMEGGEGPDDEVRLLYSKLWYKNQLSYGIRQRLAPCRQIGTVGGRNSGLDTKTMANIADVVIMRMSKGELAEEGLKSAILSLANTEEVDWVSR